VEILRRFRVFDDQRLDWLSDGYGEFSEQEARSIAATIERYVLPDLKHGDRVLLDGSRTNTPDDGTFYRMPDDWGLNYSADFDWLIRFCQFCKECGGLYVF